MFNWIQDFKSKTQDSHW